jgi:hypothetical protein
LEGGENMSEPTVFGLSDGNPEYPDESAIFADNDDWYPEYDDWADGDYREDFYMDDNDPWIYDAEDEGWPYPDEDDETEAPF